MNILNYKPLYKKNLIHAGPVILSQIGIVTVSLVDNMMVGHVGTTELAAASFASNVFHLGLLFGMGICIGLTPLVGKVFSQKKEAELGEYFKNGVFIHFISSLLIVILMGGVSIFLNKMGQPAEVVEKAFPYYLLLVISLLPLLFFYSFKQFLEGVGNTSISMYITLLSNAINILLNYILIFGKLGFPAMGLMGAGWATLIARFCMPLLLFVFIYNNKVFLKMFLSAYRSVLNFQKMKEILSVGIPIGLQLVVEVTTFAAGAVMMGWIGKEALAGHQVALSLATVTYMISLGIGSGTTIQVSHEYGLKNYITLKRSIYASLHLVVSFMAIMGLGFVLLRNQLPFLFSNDVNVIVIAAQLLVVAALFQIFDGIQIVLLGALRGISDVSVPMFLAFLSYTIVGLPISYLFAFVFNFGAVGIWIGFLLGLGLASILFYYRLRRLSVRYI
ncbi:MATE family efflux transporter [Sunxiuqinia sp. A32]|uniref:MATE family efflux transporter n=1 Tax=Sunxiuqinia sp. A32 TaxID=3461496 RepID=UPI0040459FF0